MSRTKTLKAMSGIEGCTWRVSASVLSSTLSTRIGARGLRAYYKVYQLNRFYEISGGKFNFVPVRLMNMFEAQLMRILGYEMSLDNFY